MLQPVGAHPSGNFPSCIRSSTSRITSPRRRRDSRFPRMQAAQLSLWLGSTLSTFLGASQAPYMARKFQSRTYFISLIGSRSKPLSQYQPPSWFGSGLTLSRPGKGLSERSSAHGQRGKGTASVDSSVPVLIALVSLHSQTFHRLHGPILFSSCTSKSAPARAPMQASPAQSANQRPRCGRAFQCGFPGRLRPGPGCPPFPRRCLGVRGRGRCLVRPARRRVSYRPRKGRLCSQAHSGHIGWPPVRQRHRRPGATVPCCAPPATIRKSIAEENLVIFSVGKSRKGRHPHTRPFRYASRSSSDFLAYNHSLCHDTDSRINE